MSYLGLGWSRHSFCWRSRRKSKLLYALLIPASGAPSVNLWELFICHSVAYFSGKKKIKSVFFVVLRHTLRCLSPAPDPECNMDWHQSQTLLGGSAGLSPAVVSQLLLAGAGHRASIAVLGRWCGREWLNCNRRKQSLSRGPAPAVQRDSSPALCCTALKSSSAFRGRLPGTWLNLGFIYPGFFLSSR